MYVIRVQDIADKSDLCRKRTATVRKQPHATAGGRRENAAEPVAPPGGSFPLWVDVQKLCTMCVLSLSWNFFVSHDKYIARPSEQTATLINRQYNRDWGTSYSRPPIYPYLTSPLLQNPGGATDPSGIWYSTPEGTRLSRPRHCSKGAQPVPRAAYRSYHDKQNRPR